MDKNDFFNLFKEKENRRVYYKTLLRILTNENKLKYL